MYHHRSVGRAIAQTFSRWFATAAVRIRSRVCSYGGQIGSGLDFLRILRFPLPIFIPLIAPQSPSVMAAVSSGLSLTPLRIITEVQGYYNLNPSGYCM
jgi:hypothetical protein